VTVRYLSIQQSESVTCSTSSTACGRNTEGAKDRVSDGVDEGMPEGGLEGVCVGVFVGYIDGSAVGWPEGLFVG
jgi:hypothetical protein